jgi:transposase-like protein
MTTGKRKSERSTRDKLCSPGRPPIWQREHLCRFWRAIAAGLSSEDAGVEAGVSAPVASRWFRSSGGMAPTHLAQSAPPLKGRALSFAEREEIALECARGSGVRAIARKLGRSPSTISREIRRNSAPFDDPVQRPDHPLGRQGEIGLDTQPFAIVVIQNIQEPELPPV